MDQQKLVVVLLICLLIGGGIYISMNKFNENKSNEKPSTSSPSEDLSFESLQPSSTPSAQTPTSKMIKQYRQFPGVLSSNEMQNKKAVLQTNKGVIEFEIFADSEKSSSNFIFLSRDGFYDGLTFHRVVPGFVIQGGDPKGDGSGGPGYKFEDESVNRNYDKGIVAMANAGPNTNGSQFFIMLENHSDLPPKYNIFGKVIKGTEVVDKIAVGDIILRVLIEDLK